VGEWGCGPLYARIPALIDILFLRELFLDLLEKSLFYISSGLKRPHIHITIHTYEGEWKIH
jgi:hypothetical protein